MMREEFDAEAWIEDLALLFPPLVQAQEPYLREYQERHGCVIDLRDGRPPPFPLDDLRSLYDEVRNSSFWGMEAQYAPLRAVLDPVRHKLLAHPTLERVAVTGRLIGDNEFWMQVLGSGGPISAGDLIAGLMARAVEFSHDGLRTALRELNGLLVPVGGPAAVSAVTGLAREAVQREVRADPGEQRHRQRQVVEQTAERSAAEEEAGDRQHHGDATDQHAVSHEQAALRGRTAGNGPVLRCGLRGCAQCRLRMQMPEERSGRLNRCFATGRQCGTPRRAERGPVIARARGFWRPGYSGCARAMWSECRRERPISRRRS